MGLLHLEHQQGAVCLETSVGPKTLRVCTTAATGGVEQEVDPLGQSQVAFGVPTQVLVRERGGGVGDRRGLPAGSQLGAQPAPCQG